MFEEGRAALYATRLGKTKSVITSPDSSETVIGEATKFS
jgi:hypothetical protein